MPGDSTAYAARIVRVGGRDAAARTTRSCDAMRQAIGENGTRASRSKGACGARRAASGATSIGETAIRRADIVATATPCQ